MDVKRGAILALVAAGLILTYLQLRPVKSLPADVPLDSSAKFQRMKGWFEDAIPATVDIEKQYPELYRLSHWPKSLRSRDDWDNYFANGVGGQVALPPNSRVLELGSGVGAGLDVYARHSPGPIHISGIEMLPEVVTVARQVFAKYHGRHDWQFVVGLVQDASSKPELAARAPFDVIASNGVLCYLGDLNLLERTMEGVWPWLAPGGRLHASMLPGAAGQGLGSCVIHIPQDFWRTLCQRLPACQSVDFTTAGEYMEGRYAVHIAKFP